MKKIFLLIMFVFTFVLVSCGGSSSKDLKTLRSVSIDDAYLTKYNINFSNENNSTKLYKEDRKANNYYDIYVSNDVKSSLVTYSISFDEYFNNRLTEVPVNSLTFLSTMYSDEASAIASEAFNAEYGIPQLDLGFEANDSKTWSKVVSVNALKKAYADGMSDINLTITYLPVYAVRVYESKEILKTYCFLPVYMNFTKDGKEIVLSTNEKGYELKDNQAFNNFKVEFEFDENNITLKSKVTQPTETTTQTTTTKTA